MGKKKVMGVIGALTILLGVILGSGAVFDFSQTTTSIGQIGDNIINNYLADQGIDLDEFKVLCDTGQVHEELKIYCNLLT